MRGLLPPKNAFQGLTEHFLFLFNSLPDRNEDANEKSGWKHSNNQG